MKSLVNMVTYKRWRGCERLSLVKYILCFALVEFEPNLECLFDGGDDGT